MRGNEKILNAFDIAQFDHQHNQDSVELGVKEVTRPCPRCGVAISKGSMCPHTTCTCGYQFCWHCLNPKTGGRHVEPDCGNSYYGAHDDHDDRNDNRD